jgi:5-methylcytosine-specific restriction endonuclease McrA
MLGACPSERGLAGTTPDQVKQSLIGAGLVWAGALAGPLLDGAGDLLSRWLASRIAATAAESDPTAADVPAFARSQYGRMTAAQRAGALGKSPTCPYCGTSPSTQADHVNALKQDWQSGGWTDDFDTRTARVNDPGNLIGACQACNASKGARLLGPGVGEWWPPGWPTGIWWPFGGP